MDNIKQIAKTAHEVNRVFCEFQGDNSQLPWDSAPEWQRMSAIAGVIFLKEHPEAGVSALHDNWVNDKLADGWTYGPVKDAELKTHPCIVPFERLPRDQQYKDHLFRAVVLSNI
jgi:hypothetical protein